MRLGGQHVPCAVILPEEPGLGTRGILDPGHPDVPGHVGRHPEGLVLQDAGDVVLAPSEIPRGIVGTCPPGVAHAGPEFLPCDDHVVVPVRGDAKGVVHPVRAVVVVGRPQRVAVGIVFRDPPVVVLGRGEFVSRHHDVPRLIHRHAVRVVVVARGAVVGAAPQQGPARRVLLDHPVVSVGTLDFVANRHHVARTVKLDVPHLAERIGVRRSRPRQRAGGIVVLDHPVRPAPAGNRNLPRAADRRAVGPVVDAGAPAERRAPGERPGDVPALHQPVESLPEIVPGHGPHGDTVPARPHRHRIRGVRDAGGRPIGQPHPQQRRSDPLAGRRVTEGHGKLGEPPRVTAQRGGERDREGELGAAHGHRRIEAVVHAAAGRHNAEHGPDIERLPLAARYLPVRPRPCRVRGIRLADKRRAPVECRALGIGCVLADAGQRQGDRRRHVVHRLRTGVAEPDVPRLRVTRGGIQRLGIPVLDRDRRRTGRCPAAFLGQPGFRSRAVHGEDPVEIGRPGGHARIEVGAGTGSGNLRQVRSFRDDRHRLPEDPVAGDRPGHGNQGGPLEPEHGRNRRDGQAGGGQRPGKSRQHEPRRGDVVRVAPDLLAPRGIDGGGPHDGGA